MAGNLDNLLQPPDESLEKWKALFQTMAMPDAERSTADRSPKAYMERWGVHHWIILARRPELY